MTNAEALAVLVLLVLIFWAYIAGCNYGHAKGYAEGRRDERRRSKRKEGELSTTPPNATSHASTS